MADPNYWKQQYFLAGRLKTFLPEKKMLVALELAPTNGKYVGYMCPPKESGCRLDRYIAVGERDKDLDDILTKQAQVFMAGIDFCPWVPSKKIRGLRPESVDVGMLAPGTATRLGIAGMGSGLAEVSKALKFDGRLLIIADEEDETTMGGQLEAILEAQDSQELEELGILGLEGDQEPAGQVLKNAGFRLIRVIRDECGLTIGVCLKRQEEKPPKPVRKRAKAVAPKRKSRPPPPPRGARTARRAFTLPKPATS